MFNPRIERDYIVKWIKEYFRENGCRGAVLGISGGKDSGVVAGLLTEALGPENVIGLTMPCFSKQKDADLARLVADRYGFELLNLDLSPTFDTFTSNELFLGIDEKHSDKKDIFLNSDINLKPRLRMAATYYMAALLSATKGGIWLVAGTGNAAEYFVGYSTKWGDAGYDFNPIKAYTVQEVISIGEVIGVPPEVLYRTPDDGLSSMSDEEKMGIKYSDVHKIIRGEGVVSADNYGKIMKLHQANLHKIKPIPYPTPLTVKCNFEKPESTQEEKSVLEKKNILVVVDMQNDFINGALGTKEAEQIVGNVNHAILSNRYSDIFVTKDTHEDDYLKTREGKFLPVKHCIKETLGWELNQSVEQALRTSNRPVTIIEKPTFGSIRLVEEIRKVLHDVESVTFVGLCTDICVVSNVLMVKNSFPELDVHVLADCCAGVTPEKHQAALNTMESCQVVVENR